MTISDESLLALLFFEEKYDLLRENYHEFFLELYRLNFSILHSHRNRADYKLYYNARVIMNRRLINLLATSRLYFEFLSKNNSLVYKSSEESSKDLIKIYKSSKESPKDLIEKLKTLVFKETDFMHRFDFICELRHTTQHFDAPIDLVNFSLYDFGKKNSLMVYVTKEFLKAHERFEKNVLDQMPDKVDLAQYLASFMEVVSAIHLQIRARNLKSYPTSFDTPVKERIQFLVDKNYFELRYSAIEGFSFLGQSEKDSSSTA